MSFVSAGFTWALPSFGTCSITSVETLEVHYTLSAKLVGCLPCWLSEWSLLFWWSMFGSQGFKKEKKRSLSLRVQRLG